MGFVRLDVKYVRETENDYVYDFIVNADWSGMTPYNWVNVYSNVAGGGWEFLFMVNVGEGQTGSGHQEFTVGKHLRGQTVVFWAGVEGVIASNQVNVVVGSGGGGGGSGLLVLGVGAAVLVGLLLLAWKG